MIPAVALFSGLDAVFAACALVGGGLFMARLLLLLIGFGHDGDIHGGDIGHADAAGAHDAGHGGATDGGLQLFTVNGAMGFFMMFGLLGLALHRGSQVSEPLSIIGGFAGGIAMMAIIAKMFQFMQGFASSGNINYRDAIGQQATVYLGIPENGSGQVQVCINNQLRVMDAVAEDHKPIKTGERVQVIELISGNALIVRRG